MDFVAAVVADEQPLEVVQPSEGALDDPAVTTKSGAVPGLSPRDLGRDAPRAQLPPLRPVVVGAVGADFVGSPARSADAAPDRRHPIDERDQLGDVVAVAAREPPGKRDPGRIDQEVVLRAVSGSINRARACFGAPLAECGSSCQVRWWAAPGGWSGGCCARVQP